MNYARSFLGLKKWKEIGYTNPCMIIRANTLYGHRRGFISDANGYLVSEWVSDMCVAVSVSKHVNVCSFLLFSNRFAVGECVCVSVPMRVWVKLCPYCTFIHIVCPPITHPSTPVRPTALPPVHFASYISVMVNKLGNLLILLPLKAYRNIHKCNECMVSECVSKRPYTKCVDTLCVYQCLLRRHKTSTIALHHHYHQQWLRRRHWQRQWRRYTP